CRASRRGKGKRPRSDGLWWNFGAVLGVSSSMRRVVRSYFRFALMFAFLLSGTACATDDLAQFTGHWTLKAAQSEIHQGAQWVTEEMNIALIGHLLEFTEKQ